MSKLTSFMVWKAVLRSSLLLTSSYLNKSTGLTDFMTPCVKSWRVSESLSISATSAKPSFLNFERSGFLNAIFRYRAFPEKLVCTSLPPGLIFSFANATWTHLSICDSIIAQLTSTKPIEKQYVVKSLWDRIAPRSRNRFSLTRSKALFPVHAQGFGFSRCASSIPTHGYPHATHRRMYI